MSRGATNHQCHANGCGVKLPRRMLMCGEHWRLVPHSLREELRAATRGRCGNAFYLPFFEAAARAVECVALLEGRAAYNSYRRVATALSNPAHPLHARACGKPSGRATV